MQIRLVQWNIWFKENPEQIVSELLRIKPDIICLQEVTRHALIHNRTDIARFFAEKLHFNYCFFPAHRFQAVDQPEEETGNAILSHFPLNTPQHLPLRSVYEDTDPEYAKQRRVYGSTLVALPTGNLEVATTHLSYTLDFQSMPHQEEEADTITRIIQQKTEKYILTGDFNATPESPVVNKISRYLRHCGPDYHQSTWTTKPAEFQNRIENRLNWRIDYVFSTPDLKIENSSLIATPYSDHLPILVEFSL